MNSDTVGTQWGQDEKVLLIEPDRGGEDGAVGGMMEGETHDGERRQAEEENIRR